MFDVTRQCVILQKDLRYHERFRALKRLHSREVADAIDKKCPTSMVKFGRKLVKLIVIGPPEAGSSTLLNRFVFHYFSKEQRKSFKTFVFEFILKCWKRIITGMNDITLPKIFYQDNSRRWDAVGLLAFAYSYELDLPLHIKGLMRKLWDDEGIKASSARLPEHETIAHLLDNLDRLSVKDYVPSEQDLVMLDLATDVDADRETSFSIIDLHFSAYNISNVYPNVKRFMCMFEEVTSVLFITSLDDYRREAEDDIKHKTKMAESCALYQSVCNSKWFNSTPFIVFLTKLDLFERGLKEVPLSVAFPEYKGKPITVPGGGKYQKLEFSSEVNEGVEHVQQHFQSLSRNKTRDVYYHSAALNDYGDQLLAAEFVRKKVNDIIIKSNLCDDGLF